MPLTQNTRQRLLRSPIAHAEAQSFPLARPMVGWVYGSVIGLLALAKLQSFVPINVLTRDPVAFLKGYFYMGALSYVGILFWCATVAVCAFSGLLLHQWRSPGRIIAWLVFASVVTATLMIDDLFLIHDQVFPDVLGLHEGYAFALYGSMVLLLFGWFRKQFWASRLTYLMGAIALLGLSLVIDGLPFLEANEAGIFVEDGLKLLGIVSWFLYFVEVCLCQINRAIATAPAQLSEAPQR